MTDPVKQPGNTDELCARVNGVSAYRRVGVLRVGVLRVGVSACCVSACRRALRNTPVSAKDMLSNKGASLPNAYDFPRLCLHSPVSLDGRNYPVLRHSCNIDGRHFSECNPTHH